MTIGVEGNFRGDVLEKQEGTGNESGVHMEDLVSNSSHHTIQHGVCKIVIVLMDH